MKRRRLAFLIGILGGMVASLYGEAHTEQKVYFIGCSAGAAHHFSAFYKELCNDPEYTPHLYASGPALNICRKEGLEVAFPFSLENLSEEEKVDLAMHMAKQCGLRSIIVTDVGDPFDLELQRAFKRDRKDITRYAYVDNPEPYVPGGYSKIAVEVMKLADKVLFANVYLANPHFSQVSGKAWNI